MEIKVTVKVEVDENEWADEFTIEPAEVPERVKAELYYFLVRELRGSMMQDISVIR